MKTGQSAPWGTEQRSKVQLPIATEAMPDVVARPRKGELGDFPEQTSPEANILRLVGQVIIQKYAPPGILVDAKFSVLDFRGDTSKSLKPPQGEATCDLVRMSYVEEEGDTLVVHRSKDGAEWKVFHTQQWLAAQCAQVPNEGEQRVPCYGDYSNVSRRKRNK